MDLTQLLIDIAKQGPLVGLLLYFLVSNRKEIATKDATIESLHKDALESQSRFFGRLEALKKDSDAVLLAIKEALKP